MRAAPLYPLVTGPRAVRFPRDYQQPRSAAIFTLLTGRNLPKIRQAPEPERAIINEKAVADFTPVVEQTGILKCDHLARAGRKAFFNP